VRIAVCRARIAKEALCGQSAARDHSMRLRHAVLQKVLTSPAGPPFNGSIRWTCTLQLSIYSLLLVHALAAHTRGSLVGGLGLSVSVACMCMLCVSTAWRSRLVYAQLMMPIAALHLLLSVLHLAPLARSTARRRFGWLGLVLPAVLHGLSLYLAVRAAAGVAVAAPARYTGAPRRSRPAAPFMRPSHGHPMRSLLAAPARSGVARRVGNSSAGMFGAGLMSAPPLVSTDPRGS
jgi:hypothetical protein